MFRVVAEHVGSVRLLQLKVLSWMSGAWSNLCSVVVFNVFFVCLFLAAVVSFLFLFSFFWMLSLQREATFGVIKYRSTTPKTGSFML